MPRRFLCMAAALLWPVLLYAGTTGKIAGVVKDKETGEPLPGANVIIVGTTYGASANLDGEYVILNLPVGAYSLKASLIGYTDVLMHNVRVSADLTTEANFDLPSTTLALGEIVVVAERPLVNKGATNSVRITTAEDIKNLPVRGFRDVVGIEAGVVKVGERLYIRGGRREEIATYIDGVYQNNPLTGRASGDLANNAIEEVNYQAGGFNAEYGFANSGVILTTTKTGGSTYNVSGEMITDTWLSQTDKHLGAYSYGYNVYNFSVSGPVPGFSEKRVKFYLGGERRFLEDATPSSFAFQRLVMDADGNPLDANGNPITRADAASATGYNLDDAFPQYDTDGVVKEYQFDEQGPWPDRASSQWLWNGNLSIDLKSLQFKLGGNSQREELRLLTGFAPGADYQNNLAGTGVGFSLWNSQNNPRQRNYRDSYFAKATHTLSAKAFYTFQVNYFRDDFVRSSIVFGDNFWNVGDAPGTDIGQYGPQGDGLVNPYITQTGSRPRLDPRSANLFATLGTQPGDYWKQNWTFWGAKGDLTWQIGREHELKTGFEYRYNTYRQYQIGGYGAADLHTLAGNLAQVGQGGITAEQAYQFRFADPFGYDIFGNKADDSELGRNAAKHPKIAAVYLQDKIELKDLVLNLGLRWDYFDPAYDGIRNVERVTTTTNTSAGSITDLAEENFTDNEKRSSLSPRIGVSFPVSDRTVFHGQYGKFVQTPELQRLYVSTIQYAWNLQSGNFFTNENPNLAPIRTTAYEVGFRHQLGDNAAVDVTAYYKEIRDYVRLRNLDFAQPIPYALYTNEDYGTVKGASVTFTLRRTNRFAGTANYTLQYAAGTGSDANTFYNIAWQQGRDPTFVAPLDFDQRHTGSVNVDFRTNKEDGPTILGGKLLGNLGLNLLLTFGSGLSYTPVRVQTEVFGGTSGYFPIGQVGSATGPWTYQLDMKLDKTFALSGLDLTAYLWAINLTNALNASWVYPETGEPDNDGYLDTVAGQNFVNQWGPNGVALYQFLLRNPFMVGPPRQLRLGLQFNL